MVDLGPCEHVNQIPIVRVPVCQRVDGGAGTVTSLELP